MDRRLYIYNVSIKCDMLPMNKHVPGFSKWDFAQQKVFAGAQNHNE